jgi:hypothetical protein
MIAAPIPATYDELLQGVAVPSSSVAMGLNRDVAGASHHVPATYDELLRGASSVPATYDELIQGHRNAGGPDLSSHIMSLQRELSTLHGSSSSSDAMRGLTPSQGAQGMSGSQPVVPSSQHQELLQAYNQLLQSHTDLVKAHTHVVTNQPVNGNSYDAPPNLGLGPPKQIEVAGRIGMVRLDGPLYSAVDDASAVLTGTPSGRGNHVDYQRVEGFTFEVCKSGLKDPAAESLAFEKEGVVRIKGKARDPSHLFVPSRRPGPWNAQRPRRPTRTEPWLDENGVEIGVQYIYESATVMTYLKESLQLLQDECNVDCISSACGFAANLQEFSSRNSKVPCLMSSLHLLPLVDMMTARGSYILLLTSNSAAFAEKYESLVKSHWGIDKDSRILLVGLQDTHAFNGDAIPGAIVDCEKAKDSIVAEVRKAIEAAKPKEIGAIVSECFELPGYTNALRQHFDCPVYDAITSCNILINSRAPREDYSNDPCYG